MNEYFGNLNEKKFLILGLTYKPNTNTLRRSASLELIKNITALGGNVVAHDPSQKNNKFKKSEFKIVEDFYDVANEVDATIIMTPWDEYNNIDFKKFKKQLILDTSSLYVDSDISILGHVYKVIGKK